jgi:hypothetical protein
MITMKKIHRRALLKAGVKAGGLVAISAVLPMWGCDRNVVDFLTMPTEPEVPKDTGPVLPLPPITPNDRF